MRELLLEAFFALVECGHCRRLCAQITCALHIEASASRQRLSVLHNRVAITAVRVYVGCDSDQAALTSIFFAAVCASGFFGNVTVSTPFLKLASILSVSTLSGTWKERSNEPKFRSRR